ncbi:MAG: hypothetical protein A2Y33_14990 [Spirochaetes bacterium GWF1_51_8]|nr:MAG: hypothetical protein A2Y33_14990 [Spirochaetes bacterium GWF1_51_8]
MEKDIAQKLLGLFFKAPLVHALLVFEDNEFFGVVFKRDIELGMREGNFELYENINTIRVDELSSMLFANQATSTTVIPVIDKVGNLVKIMTYEEYESHFHFDRYIANFSVSPVLDNLDHPVVVTNHFKRILYMNNLAMETAGKDYLGWNVNSLLKQFDIEIAGEKMIVTKDDKVFHLHIHYSLAENFSYHVYQFLPVN